MLFTKLRLVLIVVKQFFASPRQNSAWRALTNRKKPANTQSKVMNAMSVEFVLADAATIRAVRPEGMHCCYCVTHPNRQDSDVESNRIGQRKNLLDRYVQAALILIKEYIAITA